MRIVKESNFRTHAARLVSENKTIGKGFIYDYSVDLNAKPATIELFMAGEKLSSTDKERLFQEAEKYGISRNQLRFREEAVNARESITETEIVRGILEHSDRQVQRLYETISSLNDSIAVLNRQLRETQSELEQSRKTELEEQ